MWWVERWVENKNAPEGASLFDVWRSRRDSNPRYRRTCTPDFESGAFDHSAIFPGLSMRLKFYQRSFFIFTVWRWALRPPPVLGWVRVQARVLWLYWVPLHWLSVVRVSV